MKKDSAMIHLNQRTPLYMALITLGCALAALTQWWIGLLTAALAYGLYQGFSRLLR